MKEIPSRHVLENLPEKACMNAFIHLKLIVAIHRDFANIQLADMLNFTIAKYSKYSGVVFLGPSNSFFKFVAIFLHIRRVYGKLPKVMIILNANSKIFSAKLSQYVASDTMWQCDTIYSYSIKHFTVSMIL